MPPTPPDPSELARRGAQLRSDLDALTRATVEPQVLERLRALARWLESFAPRTAEHGPAERWRLLVVDDEPVVLRVFQELLGHRGHEVVLAETAERALQLLEAGPFDAVITDKNLPGKNGVELATAARARWPKAAVLLVTGYASADSAAQLVGLVDGYVLKPFDAPALLARAIGKRRQATAPVPGAKKALVWVADEEARRRLCRTLSTLGVPTLEAGGDSPQTVQHPEVGVLVCDRERCGPELQKELWKRQGVRRELRFALVVERRSLGDSVEAIMLGAQVVVTRDADDAALTEGLQRMLAG